MCVMWHILCAVTDALSRLWSDLAVFQSDFRSALVFVCIALDAVVVFLAPHSLLTMGKLCSGVCGARDKPLIHGKFIARKRWWLQM